MNPQNTKARCVCFPRSELKGRRLGSILCRRWGGGVKGGDGLSLERKQITAPERKKGSMGRHQRLRLPTPPDHGMGGVLQTLVM